MNKNEIKKEIDKNGNNLKSEYLIDCCKDDIIDKIKYIIITRINTIFNLKLKINNIKPTIKPRANKPRDSMSNRKGIWSDTINMDCMELQHIIV